MANQFTANPLSVDTAMVAASGYGRMAINKIEWFKPTDTAHTLVIKDGGAGHTILNAQCETANQSQVFNFIPPLVVQDIRVTTLGSGTVYVTVDQ